MAKIVMGIATSHTPMLNTPAKDWPSFIDRDGVREFLDKDGNPARYEELLTRADPRAAPELTPERFAARHDRAQAAIERLKEGVRRAELDALIIVGDDQKELFHEDHLPSFLVYYGDTIRNVPLSPTFKGPEWSRLATARYYEEKEPRDYPVAAPLGLHLIQELVDREFDVATSNGLPPSEGEGHAHAFVRKRVMDDPALPVVPVFMNTYYPPNQPTPRRCYKFGQALREAVESYPKDLRVGIAGSGGLEPLRRRRGARPRRHRRVETQGRRGAAIIAAQNPQFRQFRDPHVDHSRRCGRASRYELVGLRTGLPHAGRVGHRARLRAVCVSQATR